MRDNKTRAEKIAFEILDIPHIHPSVIAYITFQLDEAVRESLYNRAWGNLEKTAYEKGFAAAIVNAAELAEYASGPSSQLAEKIREMKAEK